MFEIDTYCENCGQTLTLTVDKIERGGLRLVCYVQNHTCFGGGDQEQMNDTQFIDDCEEENERGVK